MLKKLYDKSRIWFALAWIIAYCALLSAGDSISSVIGVEKTVTLPIGILLSLMLLLFLKKNGLFESYGLCASKATARSMLYYLPVFIMLTTNLWYGVTMNYSLPETLLYILSMFCVGFLEEVIFRGLLFNAMRQDSFKSAVIVSSLTFGIGHIINLVNGSGAELIPNLLQVVYATAAGFMFVMIYCKTQSLMGCIIIHGLFNALSVFANEAAATNETRIIFALLLTVITSSYALYLAWTMKALLCNEEKE
jgi:membrane protease YdiL (CAAX protease family)